MTAEPAGPSRGAVERRAPDTLAEAPRPPAAPLDPTIETDLWWGSYAGRTMLPSFVLCFALTLGLVFGAYLLWSDFGQGPAVARHEFYSVAVALWLFQLVRWLYRIIGCNYRLTTRRLFCGRGFLYPATAPVDLRDVQGVAVKQLAWERWLGIGRVYVQAKEAVMLEGVHQPERIAERIRQAAARRPAFES